MQRFRSVPRTRAARREGGFTLTELMLTLLVAGILATMAVPNMSNMLDNNRRATEINRFVTALALTRSEAVKRGVIVSMCASTDGATCSTDGKWEDGWIVFVNNDGDDPPVVDAGEQILRVFPAIDAKVTLRGSGDYVDAISYHSQGYAQVPSASSTGGMFTLCDTRGYADARAVIINGTGRPRLSSDTNADGMDEDESGNHLVCP